MLLIADSGSTKCDWVLFKNKSEEPLKIRTKGLNPSVLSKEELHQIITESIELMQYQNEIEKIYFFGAGCSSNEVNLVIESIFSSVFKNAKPVVKEDTMAAVWATTNSPAVVCILGTGSNCCYYDGETIQIKSPAMGYLLMDECSGNYFGKELLRAYFLNKMPTDIKLLFEKQFSVNVENVLHKIYQNSAPNEYLAQFAIFLIQNKEHRFLEAILFKGIHDFVENHIMQFEEELKSVPICFVGSIAYYLQDEIKFVLEAKGLSSSKFVRRPIDQVIENIKNDTLLV
jgi:N-acetylglucosamine kinase-like BadF-type ATPase